MDGAPMIASVIWRRTGQELGTVPWHPDEKAKDGRITVPKRVKNVPLPSWAHEGMNIVPAITVEVADEFIIADEPEEAFHLPGYQPVPIMAGMYAEWERERGPA